jgi:hypothetical protein
MVENVDGQNVDLDKVNGKNVKRRKCRMVRNDERTLE